MNTLYLTQLALDPYAKEVRRALEDRYALHRIAYSLKGDGRKGRLLWRLEPLRGKKRPVMLVQTPFPPELGHFLAQGWGDARVNQIQLELAPGVYAFRLEANAVRRREQKARPLLDPDEQVHWLGEKLAPLELPEVIPTRSVAHVVRKPGGETYTLHAVLFEGRLLVPESGVGEAAARVLEGIGRGRSMGLGLLSLKRAR